MGSKKRLDKGKDMNWSKLFLSAVLLNATGLVQADVSTEPQDCGPGASPMRVTARHIDPNGIGYNQGYTTVEGFFRLNNGSDRFVPFLDTRVHVFNGGNPAVNAGLGVRYLTDSRVWGVNSYYDYRKTSRQHYNQYAAGLESLGKIWDFRLNGYLPVGKKTSPDYDTRFAYFRGNSAILSQTYEYSLKGFNAEAAAHVDTLKHFPLYFAAGPYYLNGKGASTWGGQIRASIRIFDYLKFEGNVSYDHLYKWIGQGQVGVSYSFGGKKKIKSKGVGSCSGALTLSERAYQPVDRFEIIPVKKKDKSSLAINPTTGDPYVFTFVDNTSSSLGTYESPYATLATAEAASGPEGVIYVFPGDGTPTGMSNGIQLKTNQKLWGSVVAQNLSTTLGTITIPAMSKGGVLNGSVIMPVITNGNNETVIAVASGNEISGFSVQSVGASGTAISNPGPATDLAVLNCAIGGPGTLPYAGIGVDNLVGTLTIDNCTINTGYGVSVYNNTTALAVNISNSNFAGGSSSAIYWLYNDPVQGTLNVENCTIGSTSYSVYVEQVTGSSMEATLNNNHMTSAAGGVYMQGAGTSSQVLSMTGNTVLSANESVYILQTANTTAGLVGNTLISTGDSKYSFRLDSNAGSTDAKIALTSNTFISQDGTSLYFNQSAGNVAASLVGNTITPYDGGEGIEVVMATDAVSQNLYLYGNIINPGEYGFYVNQSVGDFTANCVDNTINSLYDGYGIYASAGGSNFTLNINGGSVQGAYYGLDIQQNTGAMNITVTNCDLKSGSDDYTVYFDLVGGTESNINMSGNTLTGYYPIYINQVGSTSANVAFNNNTCLAGSYVFYMDVDGGTDNNVTLSGNTLMGYNPVYIDHYGGALNYTMTDNVMASEGAYGCYSYNASSGATTSTQLISGNNLSSTGSSALIFALNATGGTFDFTVTDNGISSSSTYAVASSLASGTQTLDLSNNVVTNSGGFDLTMSGGTSTWEVNGNQFSLISTVPVNAAATGGTVTCMQLNDNAVYPASSANAYVLNGTGAGSFTLNPPTGNIGNTNISTTDVTQTPCSP